jgi:hypothetical protein
MKRKRETNENGEKGIGAGNIFSLRSSLRMGGVVGSGVLGMHNLDKYDFVFFVFSLVFRGFGTDF